MSPTVQPDARVPAIRGALAAAVVTAACLAAFGRTAGHAFLLFDDRVFITENPLIAHPWMASLLALWTTPLQDLYAPLTYTLWQLLSAVVGLTPWAFHLTNVLLHALNAWLVFGLLRQLLGSDDGEAALAGALLFAVHPVQCEAVAWASATKDLLAALFALIAVRQYLAFRAGESRGAYLRASLAFACALVAKPSAAVVPVLLAVLDRVLPRHDWRQGLVSLAPWFAAAAVIVLVAARAQPAAEWLPHVAPMWLRPVVALDSLTFYLATVLLPLNLIPDYGRTTAGLVASGALVYSWIPAVALLAAAGVARSKAPLVTVAVAFFVVPLLPVLGLVPFDFQSHSNVADHYLYLAMVGPAIGLALAYRRLQPPRVAVALVFAALCAASFAQAAHWKDDATLAARTLAVNPRSRFMAHHDWGRFLEERGQLEEAMLHYRQALAADPGDLAVLNNIGNLLIKQGRYDKAIRHYTEIIAQRAVPGDTAARMHNNLGAAYLNKGMYDAAAGEFRRAIDIDPEYIDPYNNLGLVLMAFGHRAEAVEVLRRGLAVNPHHSALRRLLDLAVSRPGG